MRATILVAGWTTLVTLVASGCWLVQDDFKNTKNPRFLVIGHRGAPHAAAENTIDAMTAALTLGANAVEIDLCVTSDDVVVVWHDRDPDSLVAQARQSGIEGLPWLPDPPPSGDPARRPVPMLTAETFLATHGYSRGGVRDPAASIPTFDAFLDWAATERGLSAVYVDVKVEPAELDDASVIVDALVAGWAGRRGPNLPFVLITPHEAVAVALRDHPSVQADAALRVAWDFKGNGALEGAESLGLREVTTGLTPLRSEAAFLSDVEELLEARADRRVDRVVVWTIDDRMQHGILLYYGVDGIMTNDPATLFAIWQETLK